jgi:carboxyl-terminal processing protease
MTKKKIVFLSVSVALMLSLLGGAVFGQSSQKNSLYRYLSIFTEVFGLVRGNYVEDVPTDQLLDGAFNGVIDAVDEFSYYVPPSQMARYKTYVESEDAGIGLIVTKRFGYAYVITTVDGSPAQKIGVERGDFIEKVDGQPTQKLSVWQVRSMLRSDRPVDLTVVRGGMTKRDEFHIKPVTFEPAITSSQYGDVAYIKIPYFSKGTAAKFTEALNKVRQSGSRKLIVDLRGNAGGSVDEAIHAADQLLSNGVITSIEGRRAAATRFAADHATAYDGEVEVLTDMSTASGAEIFAGAIHGNNRGKTIGVTTYGRSIIQKFVPLPSGGGVYMTVAHYTTPDLKPIKDQGLKPDVVVDLTAQALRDPSSSRSTTPKEDLILNRALSLYGEPQAARKAA